MPITLFLSFIAAASCAQAEPAPSPRNVILLIGDGMGPQAAGLLLKYARYAPDSEYRGGPAHYEKALQKGRISLLLPKTYDWLTGDSAALSTALATGVETRPATIGVDKDGYPVENIIERAHKSGKAAGLVTDTRLTHATPAGFASRSRHRDLGEEIAESILKTAPKVMLGGGLDHFLPAGGPAPSQAEGALGVPPHLKSRGKRKDGRDLTAEARKAGYSVVFDRNAMASATGRRTGAATGPKMLGLFANSHMPDAISALGGAADPDRKVPLLEEMTVKALEILSADPEGFFLMVEAGQIDMAGHQNDPGRLLHELLVFDRTLGVILKWLSGRDDTLLMVIADHETGGFSFGYSSAGIGQAPVAMPGPVFGGEPYRHEYNFVSPEALSGLRAQKRSFESMLLEFHGRPAARRTPGALARLVSDNMPVALTEAEAAEALRMEPNRRRIRGHKNLDEAETPALGAFPDFYPSKEDAACAALSRQVSPKLGISWASGSHSATPVLLAALGADAAEIFPGGVLTMAEVGRRLLELYGR